MIIDPKPEAIIEIDQEKYQFMCVPGIPDMVYAEVGRKAKVYSLLRLRDHRPFAFKVFKDEYRLPIVLENNRPIMKFDNVRGLSVAKRKVITRQNHTALINQYPFYEYAVLMPWIEGEMWFNYIITAADPTPRPLDGKESIELAKNLASTMKQLESNRIAHCDLSSSNFIFSNDYRKIELIDIEELYAATMKKPSPLPVGTAGYSPDWGKSGLWQPDSDRFSTGILVSEILGWQFEDIRKMGDGQGAFFEDGEFSHNTKRYKHLSSRLQELEPEINKLFQRVWFSKSMQECPPINEWDQALDSIAEPMVLQESDGIGFEALDLSGLSVSPEYAPALPSQPPAGSPRTSTCPICNTKVQSTWKTCPKCAYLLKPYQSQPSVLLNPEPGPAPAQTPVEDVQAKSLADLIKGGEVRKKTLRNILVIFGSLAGIAALMMLIFGQLIYSVNAGTVTRQVISAVTLAGLTGAVQAWIFRRHIQSNRIPLYISASVLGSIIAGAVTGLLNDNLHILVDSLSYGGACGLFTGALSALGQILFMRSKDIRARWLVFCTVSYTIIWALGWAVSWGIGNNVLGLALSIGLVLVASGSTLYAFLLKTPTIEF